MTTTITTCYTCQRPTVERDAQPIRLLVPSGRYRNGVELPRISRETVYECDSCFEASSSADEHLYVVHSCGISRTIGAATPEEAAVLMLRDRGWTSTRSVAVTGTGARCEYLDCEIVDGQLQFSEQVDLP